MGIFDEVRKSQPAVIKSSQSGLIWLTMLIKYDTNGNATLLRSFSKPAKDSDIKFAKKSKPKKLYKKIKPTESEDEESLF